MPTESHPLRVRVPLIAALAVLSLALFAPQAFARYVYTGNYDDSTMSVIDTATNQVVGSPIPTGSGPDSIAVAPNGKTLYVTSGGGDITVVNTQTNQVVTTITGLPPLETIAISPDGKTAYVSSPNEDRVVVVDLQTNQAVGSIPVGENPIGVAFSPNGTVAYVVNDDDDNVSVINTATRQSVGTIPVGGEPINAVVSPDGTTLYVDNEKTDNVSVINTATSQVVGTIPAGDEPWGLGLSPDGTRLYVSNDGANTVSVIDTAARQVVGGPIPTGDEPYELAVTPDGKSVYVANYGVEDSVTVINTQTSQTSNIPVPGGPWQVAIVPDQSPIAGFTATASKNSSLSIGFNAINALDPEGTIASFNWNFGDGVTAPNGGPSTVHKYAKAGSYAVGLSLIDNEGCSGFVFTGRTAFCNGTNPTQQITVIAPNTFNFGKLIRNKSKGTAKLKLKLPYAGKISLFGKVKPAKRSTKKAGTITLNIRPKSKTKKQLNAKGSAKLHIKVKFTPTGGKARTKGKTLKLIKR
jgi:YVTN family beta-propeller protein